MLLLVAACAGPAQLGSSDDPRTLSLQYDALREYPAAQFSAISEDRFGDLYILNRTANTLLKLSARGDSLRAVSGLGAEHYQFNDPSGIEARSPNRVYIADRLNHRIEEYSRDLSYISTLYTRLDPNPRKRFGYPLAVAADNGGSLFVLDGEGRRVVKFRPDRSLETTFGGYGEASDPRGTLSDPIGLTTTEDGSVAVLDAGGASLVAFDNFGTVLARRSLTSRGRSIASVHDTVAVLAASGELQRYRLPALARCASVRPSAPRAADAQSLVLAPTPVMLTSRAALLMRVGTDTVQHP
jgi:hypothetical protein